LAVGEYTGTFRLGYGSGNDRNGEVVGIDGGVEKEKVGVAEPVVVPSNGLGVGAGEAGGAGLYSQGHVRGDYALVCIRVH
jgi:hypothetical protein